MSEFNQQPQAQYVSYESPKNTYSILALVSALVGVFIFPLAGSVVSLVFANLASKEENQGGRNNSMITASRVISWVTIVIYSLVVLAFIGIMILAAAASPSGL